MSYASSGLNLEEWKFILSKKEKHFQFLAETFFQVSTGLALCVKQVDNSTLVVFLASHQFCLLFSALLYLGKS